MNQSNDKRISWNDYFFEILETVKKRSSCKRRQIGALAVKDNQILATGYNGAPVGVEHCLTMGCLRDQLKIPSGERHELCMAVHAETNVITQAAMHGISLKDATIYCTHKPCSICIKILINSGIKEVYYKTDYPDEFTDKIVKLSGIKLIHVTNKDMDTMIDTDTDVDYIIFK